MNALFQYILFLFFAARGFYSFVQVELVKICRRLLNLNGHFGAGTVVSFLPDTLFLCRYTFNLPSLLILVLGICMRGRDE